MESSHAPCEPDRPGRFRTVHPEAVVLVLPSGRSASWELGYAQGAGKRGVVLMLEACEPDLMSSEARIITSLTELKLKREFTAFRSAP